MAHPHLAQADSHPDDVEAACLHPAKIVHCSAAVQMAAAALQDHQLKNQAVVIVAACPHYARALAIALNAMAQAEASEFAVVALLPASSKQALAFAPVSVPHNSPKAYNTKRLTHPTEQISRLLVPGLVDGCTERPYDAGLIGAADRLTAPSRCSSKKSKQHCPDLK